MEMNEYTFMGSDSAFLIFTSLLCGESTLKKSEFFPLSIEVWEGYVIQGSKYTVFDLFSALCAKLFQSGGKFLKYFFSFKRTF